METLIWNVIAAKSNQRTAVRQNVNCVTKFAYLH